MAPYKRADLILAAFAQMPERRLIFVNSGGTGETPQAPAPNITILSRVAEPDLIDLMRRARAFVFAAEEDFGITVVEAQACGTPVICFGRGGATETVLDGQTGILFKEQSPTSLIDAIEKFEATRHCFTPARIRANAERFSVEVFESNLRAVVSRALGLVRQAGA
jgi:glycosyltransferase involved in cell wall biosynthesis